MPARAAMIAPDSSAGAVTIYDEVTVEWEPIDDGDLVTIVLDVGEPILRCAVPDNGSFTISAALIAQFPAGGGSLTLARSRVRSNALLGGFLIGTGVSAQSVIVAIP